LFHQLLWWDSGNKYSKIKANSFEGRAASVNFWSEVEPLFHRLPNHVVFFAGDMGAASWSDDFMYDSYDNIELICSGMGENIGDNFVIVNVDQNKNVSYDLICLNDSTLECFGEIADHRISHVQEIE
jgi:hypothetical protein